MYNNGPFINKRLPRMSKNFVMFVTIVIII